MSSYLLSIPVCYYQAMMGQKETVQVNAYGCGSVTFHIRGTKIGVQTAHQFLLVEPFSQYQSARLRSCISQIERGKITNVSKLIEQCNGLVRFANSSYERFYR